MSARNRALPGLLNLSGCLANLAAHERQVLNDANSWLLSCTAEPTCTIVVLTRLRPLTWVPTASPSQIHAATQAAMATSRMSIRRPVRTDVQFPISRRLPGAAAEPGPSVRARTHRSRTPGVQQPQGAPQ
jgi:hypothetical protein